MSKALLTHARMGLNGLKTGTQILPCGRAMNFFPGKVYREL